MYLVERPLIWRRAVAALSSCRVLDRRRFDTTTIGEMIAYMRQYRAIVVYDLDGLTIADAATLLSSGRLSEPPHLPPEGTWARSQWAK